MIKHDGNFQQGWIHNKSETQGSKFLAGPSGQLYVKITGPFQLLLASGRRPSGNFDPCKIYFMFKFKICNMQEKAKE